MSWPLSGNALQKYNRLLDDLRQYGDFYFVGAPDDITFLWQTIIAASDGALNPSLEDVANRSHYWTLRLVAFLGGQVTPCPPCPPCPPSEPAGIHWGTDETTIDVSSGGPFQLFYLSYLDPSITSLTFNSLRNLVGGSFDFGGLDFIENFSAPELLTVAGQMDWSDEGALTTFLVPKLTTCRDFTLRDNPVVTIDCSSLVSVVGGGFASFRLENLSITSITDEFASLETVEADAALAIGCLNLVSLSYPSFIASTVGTVVEVSGNPLLVSVSLPNFFPINGTQITFSENALNDTSVNHILARAVANPGYVSGAIDLSGGTNAAPTGQGIIDAATLDGRGVNVTTN